MLPCVDAAFGLPLMFAPFIISRYAPFPYSLNEKPPTDLAVGGLRTTAIYYLEPAPIK